jgi:RES domain-containing protein
MSGAGRVHDRAILDALDAINAEPFREQVWRVTRKGRDVLRGSIAGGRWSLDSPFEVLYTSIERDGALAEIGFRLSLEPVWPDKLRHEIHRISVQAERTMRIVDMTTLRQLGVDTDRYESFEYSVTQSIAAAAHFLEFDGLLVPSARAPTLNLVLFLDRMPPGEGLKVLETHEVDWTSWQTANRGKPNIKSL